MQLFCSVSFNISDFVLNIITQGIIFVLCKCFLKKNQKLNDNLILRISELDSVCQHKPVKSVLDL